MKTKSIWSLGIVVVLAWFAFTADGARNFQATTVPPGTNGMYGLIIGTNVVGSLAGVSTGLTVVTWVNPHPSSTTGGDTIGRYVIALWHGGGVAACSMSLDYQLTNFNPQFGGRRAAADSYTRRTLTGGLLVSNKWQHLTGVLTCNGTPPDFYYNGTLANGGSTTTSSIGSFTYSGYFTNDTVGAAFFTTGVNVPSSAMNGIMDCLAVYSVPLTAAEIAQLSGMGDPTKAVHPRFIRPDKIVFAPWMDHGKSNSPDYKGFTVNWSNAPSVVAGPPIGLR